MSKESILQTDSFNNPFNEINANDIDSYRILDLWCTPFKEGFIKDIDEKRFATERLPIILQGYRGSGKTMILKYFSYSVQKERAKASSINIFEEIINDQSLGFYFRCDKSFVSTFIQVFGESDEKWLSIFEHFFELKFCKQLLGFINDIIDKELESVFIEKLSKKISVYEKLKANTSLNNLMEYINKELSYIDYYKSNSVFESLVFKPDSIFGFYTLSRYLIESLNEVVPELENITYLILVDEFENLPKELQRFFNTLVKFAQDQVTYRIGRRSEVIITTETVNDEYLRENHDYIIAKIGSTIIDKTIKDYLFKIAMKRIENSPSFSRMGSIIDLLGSSEDLLEECLELTRGRDLHLRHVLSSRRDIDNIDAIISIIAYPKDPIAETINALWVIRNKKQNAVDAAKIAREAMTEFFSNRNKTSKYKHDYNNKYRYSITCLIASVYKRQKKYYSFNTICYLSGGNARTYINICRAIFSDALFYEKDKFLEKNIISNDVQNKAICSFSNSEFNAMCSIIDRGNNIRNLILNIGNVFSEYHRDKLVRYPETNQFVFNKLELDSEVRDVVEIAESWSMIIKREKAQRVSLGLDKKGDIYIINRAFCPIFGISYRVRGGFNVKFDKDEIHHMTESLNVVSKLKSTKHGRKKSTKDSLSNSQLSLFDTGGDYSE